MTAQMLNAVTSAATGTVVFPLRKGVRPRVNTGVVHVTLGGGTATVVLEGRGDPSLATWATIATWTSDDAQAVQLMNEMRLRVSSYSSGTINGYLDI